MADKALPLISLPVSELGERLSTGALSARQVADAFLHQIEQSEPAVKAFAHHDPDFVRLQADAMDTHRRSGRPIGPLHGLPVGLKDIIDTAKIPTENGTAIDAGRVPLHDAWVVQRLKSAGAMIMGKTTTAELAYLHPPQTTNPHDPERTPGGSSSGSAAAVAAGMVSLAVGTQTGGSVIRPAAFCGVTGFKPTFGAIPRTGILAQSPSLDTVGLFGQRPEDVARLGDVLFGYDPADPATTPAPPPRLHEICTSAPPVPPVFAFIRPPGWDKADPQTHAAFEELAAALGEAQCFEIELPPHFADAADLRARVNFVEMVKNYRRYLRAGPEHLSAELQDAVQQGSATLAKDYLTALDWPDVLNSGLEEIFERADAILTPATLGPAPKGLDSTGDAIFNSLWTFIGTPAVTIPAMTSEEGLPMGVQLIGPRGEDARLLRSARWLLEWIETLSDA